MFFTSFLFEWGGGPDGRASARGAENRRAAQMGDDAMCTAFELLFLHYYYFPRKEMIKTLFSVLNKSVHFKWLSLPQRHLTLSL